MTIYNNMANILPLTTYIGLNDSLKPLKIGENINTLDLAQTQIVWRNSVKCLNKIPYLKNIQKSKPLTISFLSESWNKYGYNHLETLKDCYREILHLGGNLVVIVQAGSKEVLEMAQYFNLPFTLLADPTNQIAKQFGTYLDKSANHTRITESTIGDIPVPATYVIDKKGSIIYHSIDENFTQPFNPSEMLGAVFSAAHNIPYSINYQVAA